MVNEDWHGPDRPAEQGPANPSEGPARWTKGASEGSGLRKLGSMSGERELASIPVWHGHRVEMAQIASSHRAPSAFPPQRKRFPRSGFPPRSSLTPRGASSEGNLCIRRDLCRFGPNSASSRNRQKPGRPAERGSPALRKALSPDRRGLARRADPASADDSSTETWSPQWQKIAEIGRFDPLAAVSEEVSLRKRPGRSTGDPAAIGRTFRFR